MLSNPSVSPGQTVTATGQGCPPGSQVMLTISGRSVGTATADGSGRYRASIQPGQLAVGAYSVVAHCGGASVPASLDVVLASRVDQATSSVVILIFFVLVALALMRRQFTQR